MKRRPRYPQRRTLRLPYYDYALPGAYFVTICTHRRRCLFGEIVDSRMVQNAAGEKVAEEFLRSFEIRSEMARDAWVLMPNHLHAILLIQSQGEFGVSGDLPVAPTHCLGARSLSDVSCGSSRKEGRPKGPEAKSLSSFISGFKAAATTRIREITGRPSMPVWQRGYYEHVIRGRKELERTRLYIDGNPQTWLDDDENPNNITRKRKSQKPWL